MTTAADVPGWNSFKMIEMLLAVEEHFSITMETWDLDTVHTVGDLAQRILDKVQFRTHQASGFARDTAAEETPAWVIRSTIRPRSHGRNPGATVNRGC
jgi:hypothetical protein